MIVAGAKVYYTTNEKDLEQMLEKLTVCQNCVHFRSITLFGGSCMPHFENEMEFEVANDNQCECWDAREKKVDYWVNKLIAMWLDASGQSDFNRQLEYHQKQGTDHIFLGFQP